MLEDVKAVRQPPFSFVLSDGWLCSVCNRPGSRHSDKCFIGQMAVLLHATDAEMVEHRCEVNALAEALRLRDKRLREYEWALGHHGRRLGLFRSLGAVLGGVRLYG